MGRLVFLSAGALTGGNDDVVPSIAGNATVARRIAALAPGVHPLAVALHNQGSGSSSGGNEENDSFLAYLIIDGNAGNPVNLITPYDTQVRDGILSDDEVAPSSGFFILDFAHVIPASANSVQLVIEGNNNSSSENFTVRDLLFMGPEPEALPPFFDIEGSGDSLVLSWDSEEGILYTIRSATTLDSARSTGHP